MQYGPLAAASLMLAAAVCSDFLMTHLSVFQTQKTCVSYCTADSMTRSSGVAVIVRLAGV